MYNNDLEQRDREAWKKMQAEQDKHVFVDYDNSREETNDRIRHLGFDNISDFDIAIKNLKGDIADFDILLEKHQEKIDEIDMKLRNKNPEHDIIGAIPKLNAMLEDELNRAKDLIVKKQKEEKNLAELEAARKEFLNNKKTTFKDDIRDKSSKFEQLARAEKEMKALEAKFYAGTINNFEKARYEVLKNEIIPELDSKLNERSNQLKTKNSDEQKNKVGEIESKVDLNENDEKAEFDINNSSDPLSVGVSSEEEPKPVLENEPVVQPVAEPVPEVVKPSVEAPNLNDTYVDGMKLGVIRKAVKAIANIPEMLKAKINNRKALKSTGVSNAKPIRNPQSMTYEDITAPIDVKKYAVNNSVASVPEVVSDENIDVNKPWESVPVEEMSSKLEGYRR